MNKKIFLTAIFAASIFYSRAQTETAKLCKYNQYAGVQANQLLKQLINLNNNNTPINNPYLFTYAIYSVKSGWGVHAGIGYAYKKTTDKNSPANHESRINDLTYRIGGGQTLMLGKKFEAAYGLDFIGQYKLDKTFTTSVTDFGNGKDSSATTVTSKTTGYGLGPRFALSFHISDRVLLGTESTYYYSLDKEKQNVIVTETITDNFSNTTTVTTTNTNLETDFASFTFAVPTALFLILKF